MVRRLTLPLASALLLACSADDSADLGGSDGEVELRDLEPARAIRITAVEANPGVSVPLVADGVWIGGADRNAPIPKGRNTAFRLYVDVDEAVWIPRPIEARLYVTAPSGDVSTYTEEVMIEGDSSINSNSIDFLFGVLAEDMIPGSTFAVELFEAGEGFESLPPAAVPPSATPGPELIGIETAELHLSVMMVPIDYNFGGCRESVNLNDPELLGRYEDALFQQNPVETIELTVHEPLVVDDLNLASAGDFNALLSRIVALRAAENPDPNVYYYGLFDNCSQCISSGGGRGCLAGVAAGIPNGSMGAADLRAAIGTRFLSGEEIGIETFVHEIGHTQGRRHIDCPGARLQAQGVDLSFPHEGGRIGVWGFGVRDFQIRNPNVFADYMTYCSPTWVSDWQWTATFDRIRELTAWDAGDYAFISNEALLVGAIDLESDTASWWTSQGWLERGEANPEWSAELVTRDGTHLREVSVHPWSEGTWATVRIPLRESVGELDKLLIHTPDGVREVDPATIVRYEQK